MKPSDVKRWPVAEQSAEKPLPVSDAADPPISQEEARAAAHATCWYHNGLVRLTGAREGTVFYCPIGREAWRFSKGSAADTRPIQYSSVGVV
jgi:hypothetical protein